MIRRIWNRFLFGTLILFFSVSFISCNRIEEKQIEVRFWVMGAEGVAVDKLIPEFEKRNPNIRIRTQQIPWSAAHAKLITAYASETLPDVFQLGNTWVPEFQMLNAIEQLDQFLVNSSVTKENYFEGIWETNKIDSKLYGVPWYVDTRVLFYRKDKLKEAGFDAPPQTWQELLEISEAIKKLNPNFYSIFLPTNEWQNFIIFGLQNNSTLLKENYSYADFSGAEFNEAFTFLSKFYDKKLAPVDMTQVANIYHAFAEGFFSMLITGPWNVSEMKNRLPAEMQGKWMTAPLPSPNNIFPGYSLAGGSSLVLNSKSEHKDAAWKWIEYLSEKETQLKFYTSVSSLPSRKDAWQETTLSQNKYMQAFFQQLYRVKPTPKIPEWEQIVFAKIQQYAELVAANRLSVSEALKKLDEDVNQILEKRRWILSRRQN